jgi:hemerythrin-like domain-containing protein
MNDPMTILKDDHREAKELLKKLGESKPGKQRQAMVDKLSNALALHMQIEEKLVYPLVEKVEGSEVRHEADIEHDLSRDGVATMREMVSMPGFGAAAEALLGGLTHHIREEENEVFPKLKKKLTRAEWLELGDEVAAAKKAGSKK